MSEITSLTINGKAYHIVDPYSRQRVDKFQENIDGVVYSGNMLPMEYAGGDRKETNGITYEKQSDGTILASGTATAQARYDIAAGIPIKAGTYTLSGLPDGDASSKFLLWRLGDSGSYSALKQGSRTITVESDAAIYLRIQYNEGAVAEGHLWKPMLEKGDVAHEFASPVTQLRKLEKSVSQQGEALEQIANAVPLLTPYLVDENASRENAYAEINASSGAMQASSNNTGVSNLRICKGGDTLKYTLSTATGYPILATYDKSMKLVTTVLGKGYDTLLEGEYTFSPEEMYFRISGAIAKVASHKAEYISAKGIIQEQEAQDALPAYYRDYMTQRIDAINEKDCLVGGHGDSFIFITDTHLERNKMNSPALIKEIVNNTAVRFVINGGDTLDNDPSQAEALERLRLWRKAMQGVEEYRVMGNHDLNGSGQSVPEAKLNEDQWYGTMVKPVEGLVNTHGKPYFCVDNQSQKIRYICLGAPYSAAQVRQWLKDRLTEPEAGWSVLVIPHYLFDSTVDTIHTHGQYLINDINGVYGNMNATLIGVLAGHTHADHSEPESTNGYHLIATTCDACTGTPAKTAGTVTEQAFDVMHIDTANRKIYATRIGAGNDRQWSY